MTIFLDSDGYPTDDALEMIENWPLGDYRKLLDIIKPIWKYSDCGYWMDNKIVENNREIYQYNISTGGWSGNEEIVAALERNLLFWGICWVQSRRGGNYIFQIET